VDHVQQRRVSSIPEKLLREVPSDATLATPVAGPRRHASARSAPSNRASRGRFAFALGEAPKRITDVFWADP
jgi:hypothetical protein